MRIPNWSIGAAASIVLVVAFLAGGTVGAAAIPPPVTTYSVWITEQGLPSGTSWSATFNGVTNTGTTATLLFTGVSATSYGFYPTTIAGSASTIQYVPTQNYYITVPATQHVTVVYLTQYYLYTTLSPTTAGSISVGNGWVDAGSNFTVGAYANPGYTFSSWSATTGIALHGTTTGATMATVNASGTITANFAQGSYAATFDEFGLPSGTKWSVTFNSVAKTGTGTSITTASNPTGSYSWSVATVVATSTTDWVPSPSSGSFAIPGQLSQAIVFTEEYAVTFAVSGSGSAYPYSGYYPAGSSIALLATSSTELFSKWTTTASKVYIGDTKDSGTNATVKGATTVTAVFKTGKLCTSCTLTFSEAGLPTGTSWGVTFASVNYPTTASSLSFTKLTAGASWSAFTPVSTGQFGIEYVPVAYGYSSGYYYLGEVTTIEIVYQEEAYLTVASNPSYAGGGGATQSSGWYAIGTTYPLSAYNNTYYLFSGWSSSGSNLTLGSTTAASTTLSVTGPATLTAVFTQPTSTVHFTEYGLPSGTTWGVYISGTGINAWYLTATRWVNVSGLPWSSYSISPLQTISGGTGVEWNSVLGSAYVYNQGQRYQAFDYAKSVYLTVAVGPSGTTGTVYTPTTNWYEVGTWLPMVAQNGTGASPTFKSWSQTTGTGTIVSTSSASTFFEVLATGTVTCTFS